MSKRILVVDDDDAVRTIVGTAMELAGFTPEYAVDGREALARVRKNMPDLILLDLMMPHLSGYDVLEKLQSNPKTANLPVVIMTAMRPEDMEPVTGVKKIFYKGQFRIKELQTTVATLLDENKIRSTSAEE